MVFVRLLQAVLLLLCALTAVSADRAVPLGRRRDFTVGRLKHAAKVLTATSPGYDADKVLSVAKQLTSHSWEYGILYSALMEYSNPQYSVFGRSPFPNGNIRTLSSSAVPALSVLKPNIRTNAVTLADGAGAAGDPASLVEAAVLLGQSDSSYRSAAGRQVAHLFTVPRMYNGAVSQREAVAELWADAMYMFPPALAYYAVATKNETCLHFAITQCSRYRQVLRANTTASWNGLWTHIVGPESQTLGIWSTGNGWAAMGMARVLAITKAWNVSSGWTSQQALLKGWIYDILAGAKATGTAPNGLLKNYLVGGPSGQTQTTNKGDFGDVTGTAMLASVAYRMAVLDPTGSAKYVSWANSLRKAVAARVNSTGYAVPTVDPLNWFNTQPSVSGSPEGQSATVILAAAYRDCVLAGYCS
ncbi:unnamed protein product [Parajaminaea phylloscopi]